jgi:cardiolipin synthase (CMP-forming)
MYWVPNLITLDRLLMVPVVALLLSNQLYAQAFWLFLLVGISDGLDGYIARRFNVTSAAGALLDPIADKMVIMTCAFVLAWNEWLPLWLAVPLIARDIAILVVCVTDPRLKDRWPAPNFTGKLHSALAFSTLAIAIAQAAKFIDLGWGLTLLFVLLFITVFGSSGSYFLVWRREARLGSSSV